MVAHTVAAEAEEREMMTLAAHQTAVPSRAESTEIARHNSIVGMARSRAAAIMLGSRAAITLEHERGTVVLLGPLAMGGGVLAYFRASFEPDWLPLLLWLGVLGAVTGAAWSRPVIRTLLLGALLALAGAALAKLEVARAGTKVLGGEISTRLTGYVVNIDHLANGRVRFVIDVVKTERPQLRYQPDKVRVSASALPSGVVAGSLIAGPVKLHPPSGPIWPGGYDFSFEAYFDGLGANGYFLAKPHLLPAAEVPRFFAWLENARNQLADRIRAAISGPEGEIAAALIVGVRAGIPQSVNELLRRTGLAHILSISGLHMALVAAIAMGTIRRTLAIFPAFASRYPVKKYAAAGALALIAGYIFISGAEIAALRSFVMLAIMLVAVLMDRRALSMRNLAIAAVLVLLMSPHEIVGPSFQMSFAATAALVGAYSIWSSAKPRWLQSSRPRDQRSVFTRLFQTAVKLVAGTIVTALVAGIGTSIYGAWHFQRVSPLSLFANLAVSPVVSLIVMPFAVLAAIAMPFGLDAFFLAVMGKGLTAMLVISDWLSERSPLDAVGLISGQAVMWFTLALLAATLPTTRLRWTALIFATAGVWGILSRESPTIFVSEDARLVGVQAKGSRLLINRQQANSFTLEGWAKALAAEETVGPIRLKSVADGMEDPHRRGWFATKRNDAASPPVDDLLAKVTTQGFLCSAELCLVELDTGSIVAVSAVARIPRKICNVAELIIIQVPQVEKSCGTNGPQIIDARSLARHGAAMLSLPSETAHGSHAMTIEYAVSEPYRPWHAHRAYSRAARGMQPYVPRKNAEPRDAPRPEEKINKPE